jgi:phosphate transport system protein
MPREDFERNLKGLEDDVVQLSSRVEKAIFKSIEALKERDITASQKVVDDDDVIDEEQQAIEDRCIDLIALEAPMAGDLRVLIAAMMIANELERMGDYAEGIAKISVSMGNLPPLKPLIDIPRMADKSVEMLRRSTQAFVNRDVESATAVLLADDEVDDIYEQVYRELLTYMMADPSTIQRATYLLWVAHDLERVADRTTNIAERVIYLVTGETKIEYPR